ncbi:hypothetical protein J6590_049457 [Homalodisca vitripennis]|nr:hypothetical protein J6590_049457 [Homalodisca vitripennis]
MCTQSDARCRLRKTSVYLIGYMTTVVKDYVYQIEYTAASSGVLMDDHDLMFAENLPHLSTITSESGPQTPRVRSNFPETWLWEMIDAGVDGKATLSKTVPDTITSWMVTAFSVDPLYGLGLLDQPRKLRVFRPFFVSLDLPYSVIRGEIVAIPVVVFNYMDKDVDAEVTLENSDEFNFADYSNDVNDVPTGLDLFRKKKLRVRANDGANTAFMITPKQLGYINIKVTATSPTAEDIVERKLLVKAEGETQYKNKAVFIDLRQTNSFSTNVTLDIPKNIVPGSERIEVSAVSDVMSSSINNLANLIKMPFGCGEQNMLNFVPNIVVMEYLKNTQLMKGAIEHKILRYLEKGYQQELTYKHDDGSFSAFGNSDPSGSTWLTAFVAKSFRQAAPYITVEEKVIMDALDWLANVQVPNGSFPEVGTVSHQDMQGGAAKGLALTAYTLTAFLENTSISGLMLKLKWCSWLALYCSCFSFANSNVYQDNKHTVINFMLSLSAVVMTYLQSPHPVIGYTQYVWAIGNIQYVRAIGDTQYVQVIGYIQYVWAIGNIQYVGAIGDTQYVQVIGYTQYVWAIGNIQYVRAIGDTQYVQVIGYIQYVWAIGNIQYVGAIGDTQYVQVIGYTQYVWAIGNIQYVRAIGDTQYVQVIGYIQFTAQYRNVINKAIDFIVRNLDGLEDPYAVAICTYALTLAQHPSSRIAFNLLEAKAESSDDMKWFKRPVPESEKLNPYILEPNSVDVEMTAYALLTYIQKGLIEDGLPIMRWLISQQNAEGGFASTQDTVVAMTALAKLAEKIVNVNSNLQITISYPGDRPVTLDINRGNYMVLVKHEIRRNVNRVEINATGSGFAIAQVSYSYNVNVTGAWPRFTLDPQVDKNSDKNHLQLSICSGFVPGREANESNMAVMEVTLPSGFTVDQDSLPSLQASQNVKRVETKDGDSVVMLYFDKMTREEYCPTVKAYRTHKVAKQKPVPVTVYDYYDQSRRARMFYEPQVATLCDICEGEDCEKVCSGKAGSHAGDSEGQGGSASSLSVTFSAVMVALITLRYL